ncbi:DUF3141 domain-containing protein [Bradyrhizobium sp. SRL28]|uniref:DUF3141 domain-containing protein n=1 Tax=Bradyrhizobium sp. SRL28 TaxID=2836178 RepID=UPI00201C205D|nr:DUF3141 domain-containing protein [Bradyrhizobium sp. SRL28]
MTLTLEAIEALMPGLYEMYVNDIQEHDGRKCFSVELVRRSFKDIRAFNDNYRDEFPFGAVDRTSQLQAQIYHTTPAADRRQYLGPSKHWPHQE